MTRRTTSKHSSPKGPLRFGLIQAPLHPPSLSVSASLLWPRNVTSQRPVKKCGLHHNCIDRPTGRMSKSRVGRRTRLSEVKQGEEETGMVYIS
jgi:hypothetical protein